jgi:hypothetical protein
MASGSQISLLSMVKLNISSKCRVCFLEGYSAGKGAEFLSNYFQAWEAFNF